MKARILQEPKTETDPEVHAADITSGWRAQDLQSDWFIRSGLLSTVRG
jgi:hypothetical protein